MADSVANPGRLAKGWTIIGGAAGPAESPAEVLAAVAGAAGLQEGDAGVRAVLRALERLEPASTRAVARQVGLPVPVVAAVLGELRSRGVVGVERPSRLTERGRRMLGDTSGGEGGGAALADPGCAECGGSTVVVPAALAPVVARLAEMMDGAPAVDLALDQSFATAETKVRRVLLMLRYGLLPAEDMLLLGDDDLMAPALAAVGAALGRRLARRLAVVDVSAELLDYIADRLDELGTPAELADHDLREPLPERLRGGFDLAMTDPPYTVAGAELFLSRAVRALRPGPGRSVVFSFGPKGPDDTLAVQRATVGLGLTVQAMHRNFNEYLGAGVLGNVSHLQWLSSTAGSAAADERHDGPLYTADQRAADREYRCAHCGTRIPVGPGRRWSTIGALRDAGCPRCGEHTFQPGQLLTRPAGSPGASGGAPPAG